MSSWAINEQIMSVLGLPLKILDQNGGHLENGRHFEFLSFKFGIAEPKNLYLELMHDFLG